MQFFQFFIFATLTIFCTHLESTEEQVKKNMYLQPIYTLAMMRYAFMTAIMDICL